MEVSTGRLAPLENYRCRKPDRSHIIDAVFRELEQSQIEAVKAETDALYCEAQICMQGDVQSSEVRRL